MKWKSSNFEVMSEVNEKGSHEERLQAERSDSPYSELLISEEASKSSDKLLVRWQSLDSDMIIEEAGHAVELDKCDDLPCVTSVENEENFGSSSGFETREGREVLIEERLCQWWTGGGKRTGLFLDATGKRPAARCLAGEHGESSNNKVLKTEHFKGKENDKKVKLTEASVGEENKKDEEKMEPEKEPEPKVEDSINVEEEESLELDLPVKSINKKKRFVIESDSDEETTKDILGKKKRNSSAKKKTSSPVKDKKDDVVQDSAQGTPKNPKEKEIFQSSPKRDKNNSSPSTKMPRLKGLSETSSSFRYFKTSSDADMTQRCYFFSDRANICTSYNSFSFVFCQI